jgi:hypothetical protein
MTRRSSKLTPKQIADRADRQLAELDIELAVYEEQLVQPLVAKRNGHNKNV